MRYVLGGHDRSNPPTAEQLDAWRRRWAPPENEVPVPVPVSAVLGRTEDVAVALVGGAAYTTGLRFQVAVRLRAEPPGEHTHWMHLLDGGGDQLLLGVEYADGRIATNLPSPTPPGVAPDDTEPSLNPSGGSGGSRSYDQDFWLYPLPPPGPLVLVCAWPAFGIPESRTELDGAAVLQAASRAEVLWPWQPDEATPTRPEPAVPTSGWFARHRQDRGRAAETDSASP